MATAKVEANKNKSNYKKYIDEYMPSIILLIAFLIIWELTVKIFDIPKVILPAPSLIWQTLIEDRLLLWGHLKFTMSEIVIGFLVSLVTGMTLGILIVYSKTLERFIYPLVIASQVVPVFAIAPLFVIWFGFGMLPKILIAALVTFFPICVNQVEGLRSVDPGIINLMKSYSATEYQVFKIVRFPASLPFLFAGIQVGITFSVIAAVFGEWVGSEKGIGAFMIASNSMSRTDRVFASIIVLAVLGIVFFTLVKFLSNVLLPWQRSIRE